MTTNNTMLVVQVPKDFKEFLLQESRKEDLSVSQFMRKIIRKDIEQRTMLRAAEDVKPYGTSTSESK